MYSGISEELKLLGILSDSNEEEVEQAVKHYRVSRLSFMVSSLMYWEL